jgi:hypothetical protein
VVVVTGAVVVGESDGSPEGDDVGDALGEAVGEGDDVSSAQAAVVNESEVAVNPAATMGMKNLFMPPLPG